MQGFGESKPNSVQPNLYSHDTREVKKILRNLVLEEENQKKRKGRRERKEREN